MCTTLVKSVGTSIIVEVADLFQDDAQDVNMMKVQQLELCLTSVSSPCIWHFTLHLR